MGSINQRRFGITPVRNLAAKILDQIFPPDCLAIFEVQANQIPGDSQNIKSLLVQGGRCPSAGVTAAFMPYRAEVRCPNLLAVLADVQGKDPLFSVPMPRDIEHGAHNRRSAKTLSYAGDLPGQWGTGRGPLLGKTSFQAKVVATRTQPRRPVLGCCVCHPPAANTKYRQQYRQCADSQVHSPVRHALFPATVSLRWIGVSISHHWLAFNPGGIVPLPTSARPVTHSPRFSDPGTGRFRVPGPSELPRLVITVSSPGGRLHCRFAAIEQERGERRE